jgi:hypothetical protein
MYGLLGALVGSACLLLAFAASPGFILEMDRPLPNFASGFFPIERQAEDSYAWTRASADLRLTRLDRRSAWSCAIRLRGARPQGVPEPLVRIDVDGLTAESRTVSSDYEVLDVPIPARLTRPGVRLSIASSDTFVPGPADTRRLGVQIDRVSCAPAGPASARPPGPALASAAMAGAVFGVFLGLLQVGLATSGCVVLLVALAQASPLTAGATPYTSYAGSIAWIAFWTTASLLLMKTATELIRQRRFHPAAVAALVTTAVIVYLKLLALLHPSKDVVDALFHAHRFEAVLAGHYYFTQPMPDGVSFPYAIGLYVFASPWAALAGDHVSLLRVVVIGAEAIAGGLLYLLVSREWADRWMGVLAVILFHVVPLPYIVIGNGNLTNAFGQSAAFVAIAAATVWSLGRRYVPQDIALTLLLTLALASHVSTFGLLLGVVCPLAVLYWWRGTGMYRATAWALAGVTIVAVLLSVVLYYGHFIDTYRTLQHVRNEAGAMASIDAPTVGERAAAPTSVGRRIVRAAAIDAGDFGWPIVSLAFIGLWWVMRRRSPDRLSLMLMACGIAFVVFGAVGVFTPVNVRFERYSAEFISRVNLATAPAVAILASAGALWAWRRNVVLRLAAAGLVVAAAVLGIDAWREWFS